MTNDELLTVREVATRLKIHPETVRIWLRNGRIKGTQIGGTRLGWRVPAREVDRIVTEGFSAPDQAEA
jgi:excisionase family DNA binding protein